MKKSVSSFILLILVIVLLVVTAVYGVRFGDKGLKGVFDEGAVTLGLDLVGGSSITLEAVIPETPENTEGAFDDVVSEEENDSETTAFTEEAENDTEISRTEELENESADPVATDADTDAE